MNAFYSLPKILQWLIAIGLNLVLFYILGFYFDLISGHTLHFFWILVIGPLFHLLATPTFTLLGVYRYLSPMLLVYMPNKKKYDLHNGTAFDYLMLMWGTSPGISTRKKILAWYIEGLLKIVEKVEANELPGTVMVTGSSYFFSESTATRLGFKVNKAREDVYLNIAFNYLDLLWMYSLANGRLSLPSFSNIKMASITGEGLVARKEQLLDLHMYLLKS